jgi:chemotaxis protein MotB
MARKRHRRGAHAHENEERWLLTYADMITLLMALFMVLFSISSVNISKYQTLQQSLRAAFSGSILPGGSALESTGSTPSKNVMPATASAQSFVPTLPTVAPAAAPSIGTPRGTTRKQAAQHAANAEQESFLNLRARLEAYARAHGFANEVNVTINRDGLEVELLTDRVLFSSASAALNPAGLPLLGEIANLLNTVNNPVDITGYTDSIPTDTPQFPNNLWLSSGRADSVETFFGTHTVVSSRMYAVGRGPLDPVASNATNAGRGRNRRVVIEVVRTGVPPSTGGK